MFGPIVTRSETFFFIKKLRSATATCQEVSLQIYPWRHIPVWETLHVLCMMVTSARPTSSETITSRGIANFAIFARAVKTLEALLLLEAHFYSARNESYSLMKADLSCGIFFKNHLLGHEAALSLLRGQRTHPRDVPPVFFSITLVILRGNGDCRVNTNDLAYIVRGARQKDSADGSSAALPRSP
jgi:hypothetical protein